MITMSLHPHLPHRALRRHTLVAAAWLLAAGAAEAAPSLILESRQAPVHALPVGENLEVGLLGGLPETTYLLRLTDSDGVLIAEDSRTSDAAGNLAPRLLWAATGVLGCDLGAMPDPAQYLFVQFGEAEKALAGRLLTLAAFDADLALAAETVLPLVVTQHEQAYFSDADGCLRHIYSDDENIYLTVRHPQADLPARRFFLTPPSAGALGETIVEVREIDPPQVFLVPPTGAQVTVEVWPAAASYLGEFDGIFRRQSSNRMIWLPTDVDAAPGVCPGLFRPPLNGIMVTIDGCPSCIYPP